MDDESIPSTISDIDDDELRTIEDELFDLEDQLVDMQGSIMRSHTDDEDEEDDPRKFVERYAYRSPEASLADHRTSSASPYEQLERIVSNMETLQEVRPGQLLAVDVTDEGPRYSGGAYTLTSDDDTRIYAGRLGQVVWTDQTVHVLPIKRVKGDLDSMASKIRYNGSVLIEGSVQDGASVEATGNIWVGGSVGRADLKASGDVVIGQGIKGESGHTVEAYGSIYCRFVENATVDAGEDLIAAEAILRSTVRASDRVAVVERGGVIAGGEIRAGSLIHASAIGSESVSSTTLIVRSLDQAGYDKDELQQRLTKLNEQERIYEQNIQQLKEQRKGEGLTPEDEEEIREMEYELTQLRENREDVIAKLEQTEREHGQQRISVAEQAFTDTTVVIDRAERTLEERHDRSLFKSNEQQRIEIHDYEEPDFTFDVSTEVDRRAIDQEADFEMPVLRELRGHLVFESDDELYERDRQFRRLMELEPDDGLIVIERQSKGFEHSWWAIEVRPDEDPEEIRRYFVGDVQDSVKVRCATPREGVERAADHLGVTPQEVAVKVIEEGGSGIFGVDQQPYLLKVIKREALTRRQEDPSLRDGLVEEEVETNEQPGHFQFLNEDDGLKIIVVPPQGQGMPVTMEQVEHELEREGYTSNIDYEAVRDAIEEGAEEPVTIGPRQRDPRVDGDFEVTVSDDQTEAFLTVEPPEPSGRPVEVDEVMEYLEHDGLDYDEETVREVFEHDMHNQRICIAEGREPVDGDDAQIHLYAPVDEDAVVALQQSLGCDVTVEASDEQNNHRSVDYYEGEQTIASVTDNDRIAEIEPATDGKPGRTVYGKPIPCETGKRAEIEAGEHVERRDNSLYATHEGRVTVEGSTLMVEPVLYVEGDLGYETGNIDFDGVVVVEGRIQDEFRVEATKRVEAQSAGKATIVSEGDVVLQQGMAGREEGLIKAEGSVFIKYAENATIEAKKDVVVEQALLHSTVKAGRNILIQEGGRSSIVGGCAQAGSVIRSETIGTGMGPDTTIEVGIRPELRSRMETLEEGLGDYQDKFDNIKTRLKGLKKRMPAEGPSKLPKERRERYEKATRAAKALREKISNLKEEMKDVRGQYQAETSGEVYAKDTIHAGVKLTIQNQTLRVTETEQYRHYRLEDAEFVDEAYHDPDLSIEPPDTVLATSFSQDQGQASS